MSELFEELDYQDTPIGAVSLRRRRDLKLERDVFEIKLDDEFLMSSLFTESERALARLGLAAVGSKAANVVVGGLGLGYTAEEVLKSSDVESLVVIEYLDAVINWHTRGLLPDCAAVMADSRCIIHAADFFARALSDTGFDQHHPRQQYDAILLDIDHSPSAVLDSRSNNFYQPENLRRLTHHLVPGGVFGLWSNEPPDEAFVETLSTVFSRAWAEPVNFENPYQDNEVTQTVYLALAQA